MKEELRGPSVAKAAAQPGGAATKDEFAAKEHRNPKENKQYKLLSLYCNTSQSRIFVRTFSRRERGERGETP